MFTIEPGRLDDAVEAARLIAETDAELFRYSTGGSLEAWIELATHEWRHPKGIYSSTLSQVARARGALQGLLVSYSGRQHLEIDWSFGSSTPHLPPDLVERVRENHRLVAFLFPMIPEDAYYVQNLAVVSSARGSGLGRRLMEMAFAQGGALGCTSCQLDVDSALPAVGFYQKLGLEVLVQTRVRGLLGDRPHYRMVKAL